MRLWRAVIDPGLRSDRWLSALEYRPTNRRSIRAAVFSVEGTGQWLATWTPWHGFRQLPDDIAYRLAAGAKIVAQIHTAESIDATDDWGHIGLHFAERSGLSAPIDVRLTATERIPGNTARHRLHAETQLGADTTLLALWPELAHGVESIEVKATRPDGRIEILLFAVEIPLEWPTAYLYAKPVALPRGTRLALTAYVSNDDALAERRQLALTLSAIER